MKLKISKRLGAFNVKNKWWPCSLSYIYAFMERILIPVFLVWALFMPGCNKPGDTSLPDTVHYYLNQIDIEHEENKILVSAAELLGQPAVSIADKPLHSAISDPRNYVSLATYWWPDPDSYSGEPYIRRDGEINPETRSVKSDLPTLIEMAQRVEKLTDAYRITGQAQFAEKAIEQLQVWFIHEETAMYPHLEHAQIITGLNSGRSHGVIDTWWLIRVVERISWLEKSDYWTGELENGMKAWFTHYLNWLRNSEFGQTESQAKNNHGTWYDLQVVTYARFVGQDDFATDYLRSVTKRRISKQIAVSGRQKYETRRPRPLHYSIYNLNGLMKLAIHGEDLGVDLKNNDRWFSGSLENAFACLINRMDGVDPAGLADEFDQTETAQLFYDSMNYGYILFGERKIKNNY